VLWCVEPPSRLFLSHGAASAQRPHGTHEFDEKVAAAQVEKPGLPDTERGVVSQLGGALICVS
jgi:hypothetical protein